MPMRIPARPLSIRCWPKLISQNGTQLPASEIATLNGQITESTESVDDHRDQGREEHGG